MLQFKLFVLFPSVLWPIYLLLLFCCLLMLNKHTLIKCFRSVLCLALSFLAQTETNTGQKSENEKRGQR